MIAFGCAITARDTFERHALPGIERAREADSAVFGPDNPETLSAGYNRILDEAAANGDVEALVLLHQDLEITDAGFCETVRACFADPDAALAGAAGARGVTSLAWWDPGPVIGSYEWIFKTEGRTSLAMSEWDNFRPPTGVEDVDALDGMVLVFSRWAVENLRFDTELDPSAHGYDVDICFQAREAGKRVVVAQFGVAHHHELVLMGDSTDWENAHQRFAAKWEGRTLPQDEDWQERARRAEAAGAAAEIARNELSMLRNEAEREAVAAWEYARTLEGRVAAVEATLSWRLAARLRRLLARRHRDS